jgi:MTH538 TIR-like domain (DUF1863)
MPHPKRTVFISAYAGDAHEVDAFLARWALREHVFTPRQPGEDAYVRDGLIQYDDQEYVLGQIRQRYMASASVTLLFVGPCTHSRRYVDWELKATLQRGDRPPNGLLAIYLSSGVRDGELPALPGRFGVNYTPDDSRCYARCYPLPSSAADLDRWIEDAVAARTTRAGAIQNEAQMLSHDVRCRVHHVTH